MNMMKDDRLTPPQGGNPWSAATSFLANLDPDKKTIMSIVGILALGIAAGAYFKSGDGASAIGRSTNRTAVPMAELLVSGANLPDISIGAADARVTIIEYASMGCPHCANFHKTVLPELKKKYVDTGKVRFVFREFPLDDRALLASKLARCAPPERSAALISALFDRQETWAFTKGDPIATLQGLAKQAGFTEDMFQSCVKDAKLQTEIINIREKASEKFGVSATPTFFINGKKLLNNNDLPTFDKALEPLLK